MSRSTTSTRSTLVRVHSGTYLAPRSTSTLIVTLGKSETYKVQTYKYQYSRTGTCHVPEYQYASTGTYPRISCQASRPGSGQVRVPRATSARPRCGSGARLRWGRPMQAGGSPGQSTSPDQAYDRARAQRTVGRSGRRPHSRSTTARRASTRPLVPRVEPLASPPHLCTSSAPAPLERLEETVQLDFTPVGRFHFVGGRESSSLERQPSQKASSAACPTVPA